MLKFLTLTAIVCLLSATSGFAGNSSPAAQEFWKPAASVHQPPAAEIGAANGVLRPVWYEGEPWKGKSTRVFAWLARPEGAPAAPLPAVLLVHGGGGRAFEDWARHWASRGYVALAMDTAGQGPDGKRHDQAGPPQDDAEKFRNFEESGARDMWTWHAVGAILRGHALLASLPGVDADRVGMTGISWGGYLTCLTAGLNPRLKAAVPVYGCGFLGENSYWRDEPLARMESASRERWLRLFDPSQTIGQVSCPVLMVNGMHDFAYPPDSHAKTGRLIPEPLRHWSLRVDMPHGHMWNFPEVDAFIDQHLKPGPEAAPLVRLGELMIQGSRISVPVLAGTPAAGAVLHYTTGSGPWQQRQWESVPAQINDGRISAVLPVTGKLAFFVAVTDSRGWTTSTDCQETTLPAEP